MSVWSAFSGQSSFDPSQYVNPGAQGLSADQQQQFLNALYAQGFGTGPSPAATMLANQAQQSAAEMVGQAAASRGTNPALAMRDAQLASTQTIRGAEQQAAIAKTQEELNAQRLYGQQLNAKRQQDIENSLGYAKYATETGINNANNEQKTLSDITSAAGTAITYGAPLISGFLGLGPSGKGKGPNYGTGASTPITAPDMGGTATDGPATAPEGNPNYAARGGLIKNGRVMMADGGAPDPMFSWPTTQQVGAHGMLYDGIPANEWVAQHGGHLPAPGSDVKVTQPNAGTPQTVMPGAGALPLSPLYRPGGTSLQSAFNGAQGASALAAAQPNPNAVGIGSGTTSTLGQPQNIMQMMSGVKGMLGQAAATAGPTQHVMMASGGMAMPKSMVGRMMKSQPMRMASGGKVPALVSPGEIYLPPQKVEQVAEGKASPMSGQRIPGKAPVQGNSYANDTVHKTLDEGGIVLPRSVTQHPNAPEMAARFVAQVLKKQGFRR